MDGWRRTDAVLARRITSDSCTTDHWTPNLESPRVIPNFLWSIAHVFDEYVTSGPRAMKQILSALG